MSTTETPIHCFEKAGLGRAPFRCVGVASIPSPSLAAANPTAYNLALSELPRDVGCGSCSYCGTAIMQNYIIRSDDGRKFVVGSDCVAKTGDAGLIKAVRGERLKVVRAKRETVRRARADERAAIYRDQRAAQAEAFKVHNADLIAKAEPFFHIDFVKSVIGRGLEGGYVSDKALTAVERVIAEQVETARLRETSAHVGKVGERLTLKVRVQRVRSFERPSFNNPRYTETVWVVTMRDEAGNAIVSKSPSFQADAGEKLTIKATVKEHGEYNGEKQTVVQRIKAL